MQQPLLSFMISTYNKVDYLKIILNDLVNNVESDEEIVIVDGGSTDGTADFLQEMLNKQLINNFISEKDAGEGHGFNKAILLSKGKLVTILTDDDAFNYTAIRKCKTFMLKNPELDFLFAGGGDYRYLLNNDINYFTSIYKEMIIRYKINRNPFSFCLLGSIINKASLPLLGFINPAIKRADAEYSLRITSGPIKIAFYILPAFVRILNDRSNTSMYSERIKIETDKLNDFYDFYIDGPPQKEMPVPLMSKVRNRMSRVYRLLYSKKKSENALGNVSNISHEFEPYSFKEAFINAKNWLEENHVDREEKFITNL